MTLGQKLRQLRHLEGELRGLGRELTQSELVRAIRRELGETISQPYLSLIEKGTRRHLSQESRQLLARFFKVHPGYLVSDPPGYQHRAHVRRGVSRNGARSMAAGRGDPVRTRPGARRRARPHRHARGVAAVPGSARRNDFDAGPHRSTLTNARPGGANMNWPAIFLGCFVVGFLLSVLSVAFGVVDAHVHFPWETRRAHRYRARRTRDGSDQFRDDHRVCRLVRRRGVPPDHRVPLARTAGDRRLDRSLGCAAPASSSC